jgi:hypothetical protein
VYESDELPSAAEGGARVSANSREQRRAGRGPAVRLEQRRHVLDGEKLSGFVQDGNGTVSAWVDSQDGSERS